MKKYSVLDLYAGIGRCSAPFRSWRCTKSLTLVDVNDYAAEVYRKNFPNADYRNLNLSNLPGETLRTFVGGKLDILLGCPPCQGFSDCGSRNKEDPRNNHISRMTNLINALRPKVIAMENVPLAASSEKFDRLEQLLDSEGYVWRATIANAALWGSCQTRQRLIVIAFKKEIQSDFELPAVTHGGCREYFSYSTGEKITVSKDPISMLGRTPAALRVLNDERKVPALGRKHIPTVGEVLAGLPPVDSEEAKRLNHVAWAHSPKVLRRMGRISEGGRWKGGRDHFSQTYGRLHREGLSRTITGYFPNAGSGRFWHPTENRAITLREAARIQGIPDSFKFLNRDFENCVLVGNALDNALAQMTFQVVRDGLA